MSHRYHQLKGSGGGSSKIAPADNIEEERKLVNEAKLLQIQLHKNEIKQIRDFGGGTPEANERILILEYKINKLRQSIIADGYGYLVNGGISGSGVRKRKMKGSGGSASVHAGTAFTPERRRKMFMSRYDEILMKINPIYYKLDQGRHLPDDQVSLTILYHLIGDIDSFNSVYSRSNVRDALDNLRTRNILKTASETIEFEDAPERNLTIYERNPYNRVLDEFLTTGADKINHALELFTTEMNRLRTVLNLDDESL
jgi:hypothetical protein